jgi:hypothetical protein
MTRTPEASERQRKAAYKAWETIRRKKANGTAPESIVDEAHLSPKRGSRKLLNASSYPANWEEIRVEIRNRSRNEQGQEQCECRGECLKHSGRCGELNGTWARLRRSPGKVKIRFTIAHLCHTPSCDNRSHLKAMCEPCHLIYDLRCRQRHLRGEEAVAWALEQSLHPSAYV